MPGSSTYDAFRVKHAGGAAAAVSVAQGRGAVASAARQASELAVDVLRDGGNAFDAAFATAFSLCIYQPQAGNLGGGGYLLFKPRGAAPTVFNYREQAPAGAVREAFLKEDGTPDPDRTAFGPTSVCVPGTVKAFFELQRRHGRLRARDLLLRTARCAEEGARITQYEADCLNRLAPRLAVAPESRRIYVRDQPYAGGDLLPNPTLGQTLTVLANEGEQAFYRGRIAEQIVDDLAANGGFVSAGDLERYEVREVRPIAIELAGRTVWTVPPEGGGPVLLQILAILDREAFRRVPFGSPEYHHHVAQASKLAFIERLQYLGDIPLAGCVAYRRLLTPEHASRLFGAIDPRRDTAVDALAAQLRAGEPAANGPSGNHTTHFAIIDAEGNAVSNSYTLNLRFGSKWAVKGAGFFLNGSIDAFSFVEGKENYFGVIGSVPNLFAPGKRPASNMAPVLVTAGDEVELALGTPGGPTIQTALANVLLATLVHQIDPVAFIPRGRLHHQGWPDVLAHEPDFDDRGLLAALSRFGYGLKDKQESIADVQGVMRAGDEVRAFSDFRREGGAAAC